MNETETRLLDALDSVIGQHGPSGVTLRRVGTEAGLSHTAAAHYYKDKSGLFTAYITRAFNDVGDRIDIAAELESPLEAMFGAASAYAGFATDSPAAFSVMNRLELANLDAPELWQARERCYFGIQAILLRAQEGGWAADRDIRDLLATVWSFVHGFVDLWVGGPLAAPYDGDALDETLRRVFSDLLQRID